LRTLAEAVRGLGGKWRLLICGSGPLKGELQTWSDVHGLKDRVTLRDHVCSQEMPRVLNSLDVLVLPSLTRANWKEQFGRVLVEAMACGVAVIGSDSGAIPTVIEGAGLVFPEGNADALRECLATLQADPEVRAALGRAGRQRVLERYTQAQVAARTVSLYRDLICDP